MTRQPNSNIREGFLRKRLLSNLFTTLLTLLVQGFFMCNETSKFKASNCKKK